MTTRSNLSVYNNVAVTASYRYNSDRSLRLDLFHALDLVVKEHPALSAIPVATNTTSPYFVRLPEIDLEKVVTFSTINLSVEKTDQNSQLDRFLEAQHNSPFHYTEPPSPFWRIYVLEDPRIKSCFELSFVFHHCITDTKGAITFHEALEAALGSPGHKRCKSIVIPTDTPLLPPLDDFEAFDAKETYSEPSYESSTTWTGQIQSTPVKTRFTSLWISAESTKQFAAAVKRRSLSVTAVLQAVLVAAIFRQLPLEYKIIKVDCPVSLRSWLSSPIKSSSMGCFIDNFSEIYHRSPFNWEEAQRTKNKIDEVIQRRQGDKLCRNVRMIPDLTAWFEQKMGKSRQSALELSNVGNLGASTNSGCYRIEDVLFSQSAGACSGAIKVSAVTGRNGRLSLGFTWQEGVVDDGLIIRVVKEFQAILSVIIYEDN